MRFRRTGYRFAVKNAITCGIAAARRPPRTRKPRNSHLFLPARGRLSVADAGLCHGSHSNCWLAAARRLMRKNGRPWL